MEERNIFEEIAQRALDSDAARKTGEPAQPQPSQTVIKEVLDAIKGAAKPSKRGVQIAALWLLYVSYGQLAMLFGVHQNTVYNAINKYIPIWLRAKRQPFHGKPPLSHEQAAMYFEAISRVGYHEDAIRLAAAIQEATKNTDWTE